MAAGLKILMLLTDGFGGRGGIAQFNRDFLAALDHSGLVERIHALPRLMIERSKVRPPEAVVYDRIAARGRFAYFRRLLAYLSSGTRPDLVICGHLHLLPAAWLVAKLRRARLALIIHGIEAWTPSRKFQVNRLARAVDAFIAVSRHSAERFTIWSKLPMERSFILPCCVDLDRFRPQPKDPALIERYRLQDCKVIMTMGRLAAQERYKGCDQIIELMPELIRRYPDLKYMVIGEGDDRLRLEVKTKTLGIANRVIFTGHIPEAEKVAHYNLADAYVMPSTGEGFGIVLIEAAACGLPVVGSAADASREALIDGELGRLIDPLNPSEIFDAISAALDAGRTHQDNPRIADAIATFGVRNFRTKVVEWCLRQKAAMAA